MIITFIKYLREKRWKCILMCYIIFFFLDSVISGFPPYFIPLKVFSVFFAILFGEMLYRKMIIIINYYAIIILLILIYVVSYVCNFLGIDASHFY